MDIRLLGSVGFEAEARVVRPVSGRAGALLASLAWQPGEFVSDGILSERIWGVSPPVDPRGALFTAAKRLRQALAEAGHAHRVVRHRGGYLLDIGPEGVDLHRFRSLVGQGRAAAEDEAAARFYESAAGQHAGTPLADVESAWAERVREALRREHLAVRVAAAAAWLRVGRTAGLVPDLSYLADEHPLDETITGLLMLALHRRGRQAEALERYSLIRGRLIEELGDEPGGDLQDLHAQLLRRNASARTCALVSSAR
ncbi:AfsR/SARP family transcriptional regulator [Streptomyces sp. NBC_01537]|uniref:AfsR/SARP family transcriptional regulator n=1 Tax=Streptomyces sp. NBC_01537 TaxID=2903896 RepID=UPI00386AA050